MTTAVIYHSVTGNTRKVAEAIAKSLSCAAQPVKEYPLDSEADVMFIGGAVYGGRLDAVMDSFLKALSPQKVKRAVLFSTSVKESKAIGLMRDILVGQGIAVDNEAFVCKGKFLFFNLKHPNKTDLEQAEAFAQNVMRKR